jgi:DNA-binding transcriptional MerR regulator
MTPRTYPLHEIVRLTGLTPRSIRYYIERDMLPGPEQRGVATVYTHEQLVPASRRYRSSASGRGSVWPA